MTNLQFVHEKCVEANPAIIVNKHAQIIHQDHSVEYFEQHRPVRLADVLLAMADCINGKEAQRPVLTLIDEWDLRKDDLTEQSEETINFLAELLK